jgi:hypothetical protein
MQKRREDESELRVGCTQMPAQHPRANGLHCFRVLFWFGAQNARYPIRQPKLDTFFGAVQNNLRLCWWQSEVFDCEFQRGGVSPSGRGKLVE